MKLGLFVFGAAIAVGGVVSDPAAAHHGGAAVDQTQSVSSMQRSPNFGGRIRMCSCFLTSRRTARPSSGRDG